MDNLVVREDRAGCAILSLNRPDKLNALTVDLFKSLRSHVDAIAADPGVGVVVLRGNGRCFSAGHDLSDIAAGEAPPSPNFQAETIERLANLPQPVITAVHGHCYTGGLELALAGDIIIASASARFGDTHAKWALTPVWGLSQRLPRRVGSAKAREMMFTCRTLDGAEAAAIGLANLCVADDGFEAAVRQMAEAIASQSWFSHRANKRLLLETDGLPLSAGLAHESYRTEGAGPDVYDRLNAFRTRKA
ncbi:MAG: enoyl-CoA hydratase/isomerase family protein [Proteobacteria bacterium]|nr:enoyl-CoA hydratase/isomerase family protein [Pseudomonadota bacterium]